MAVIKVPRGIRNNNPLNIRYSAANHWEGRREAKIDLEFEEFISDSYGLRAGFILINNYIRMKQLDTVEKIIRRWAPPSENNTENYINTVCCLMHIKRDMKIFSSCTCQLLALVRAMAFVEVGKKYDWCTLLSAYIMSDSEKPTCIPYQRGLMKYLDSTKKEFTPCTF